MNPKVLYEDDILLVIDKPAGIVVNRAESTKGETVQDWVEKYLGTNGPVVSSRDFEMRSGVVHRLDKETSGVLIIAKIPKAFEGLQKQFKERQVKKTYVALVHGELKQPEGVINASVGRLPWNRERFGVFAGGREAETNYKRIKIFDLRFKNTEEIFTLLELFPKTGRTHQLRVHLKSIGHPIVSDNLYAGRKTARKDRLWCPRLFLHAKNIAFLHPYYHNSITVDSSLPSDLTKALTCLVAE